MSLSGPCWGREGCLAYREVTMLEVKEVLRLWLRGTAHKRIAAQLGLNVKTVRRYVAAATAAGVTRESRPEDLNGDLIATVVSRVQPHVGRPRGDGWADCATQRPLIERLLQRGVRLSKLRKLLRRVGWIKIVPKNVLAATWVWTDTGADGRDYVSDVDIFYNLSQPWGVFQDCSSTETRFEVGNVGTHEIGHVIGLAHVSDVERQATMYPSAPEGRGQEKDPDGG